MAENNTPKAPKEAPRIPYLFRRDGQDVPVEMDSRGYYTHVFIRTLAEQTGLPAAAISLHVQDPDGEDHALDPSRMLDEQVVKFARLGDRSAIATTPIHVVVDVNVLLAQSGQSVDQSPNLSHIRSLRFRRPCVTVKDPKKTDPVSVMRLARSVGAVKHGGFLWLSRRYLVKLGESSEHYYSYVTLTRAMGFAY